MVLPVGVGSGVKKGKRVLDWWHSGTQVGQDERVRSGVGVSSAATKIASTATAAKVVILANIVISGGWVEISRLVDIKVRCEDN